MRFRFAHKFSTYCMVLCAYCALVFSGELSDLVSLLGFVGIFISWYWEPPRVNFEKLTIPWTVLSLLVLAYTVVSTFGGGDFLLIGGEFLIFLLVAKMCNRRACRDYLQVYLLSFLMLVAGTVLNTEFTYGVFFLGYVIFSTWAVILFHLRREMEDNYLLKHSDDMSYKRVQIDRIMNSRRIVGRRFFFGTAMVSLTIFAAASVLFLAIPRIGFGMFFQNSRGSITMTGFSDGVTLGGHGLIKTDDTIVMRVYVDDAYEGRSAPYIHWRGVAFETYEKGVWKRRATAPRTRKQISRPREGVTQHHLLYADSGGASNALQSRAERGMSQEIYLEPFGYDVLFGASMPLAFEFENRFGLKKPRTERNDEMRFPHSSGIKYTVYSDLLGPNPADLRQAEDVVPETYEPYLALPPEITEQTKALAREITRGLENDYDKADAVRKWLQTNLSYTLKMRSPGKMEPIHFFLFERKQGHCEYFSSAMAILLRVVDVPTRNVNGFLGGEWNESGEYIAVRAGDAHSWVEVYFHGYGWVTFDPTPPGGIDRLGRGGSGVLDRLGRFFDTLRFQWFKWVIDYDLTSQLSIFRGLREYLSSGTDAVKQFFDDVKAWAKQHKALAGFTVVLVSSVLVALVWWRMRKRRRSANPNEEQRERDAVSLLYERVLARLAKRGYRRLPSTTPREFAREFDEQKAPGAAALATLTELHYQVAYGSMSPEGGLTKAYAASEDIERAFAEAKRASKRKRASERTPTSAMNSSDTETAGA